MQFFISLFFNCIDVLVVSFKQAKCVKQICLESIVKDQHINQFNDVFDLPEQSVIRRDCHDLVGKSAAINLA